MIMTKNGFFLFTIVAVFFLSLFNLLNLIKNFCIGCKRSKPRPKWYRARAREMSYKIHKYRNATFGVLLRCPIILDFIDWFLVTTHTLTAEMCWAFLARGNRCCWGPVRFFYYYLSYHLQLNSFVSTFCEIGSERREILSVDIIFLLRVEKSPAHACMSHFFATVQFRRVSAECGNRVLCETRDDRARRTRSIV